MGRCGAGMSVMCPARRGSEQRSASEGETSPSLMKIYRQFIIVIFDRKYVLYFADKMSKVFRNENKFPHKNVKPNKEVHK